MVNTLVIQNERRWFGGLSNLAILPDGRQVVAPRFRLKLEELQAPFAFANGLGATYVIDSHRALLENQVGVQPRRPVDHMKLLATINRRVADKTGKRRDRLAPSVRLPTSMQMHERHPNRRRSWRRGRVSPSTCRSCSLELTCRARRDESGSTASRSHAGKLRPKFLTKRRTGS